MSRSPRTSAPPPEPSADDGASCGGPGSDCDCALGDAGPLVRLVSRVFGFMPADSLVFVGLRDSSTGGHMRIDLSPALRDPAGVAQWSAQRLAGDHDGRSSPPEAVLVLIFEPGGPVRSQAGDRAHQTQPAQQLPGAGDPGVGRLVQTLRNVFEEEYCIPVARIYSIREGYVRDYDCPQGSCAHSGALRWAGDSREERPGEGQFDQPSPGNAGLGNAWRGSTAQAAAPSSASGPEGAALSSFQAASSADFGQRVVETFLSGAESRSPEVPAGSTEDGAPLSPHVVLDRWEQVISSPAGDRMGALRRKPALTAVLSRSLESRVVRDVLIPLAAESLDLAVQVLPPELTGSHVQDDHRAMSLLVYRDIVLGESGHAPRWDRIDRLARALQICHQPAGAQARENIYGLMAWIEWVRGRGSAAGGFIDHCLARYPDNVLCRLIDELMRRGQVCPWAQVREHSWSWQSGAGTG